MKKTIAMLPFLLVFATTARADNRPADVDARGNEARTACMASDVSKGIRLLAELYTATLNPSWIFNQARCYEQNAQPELALSRFKEYLRKSEAGPEDPGVREAKQHVAELEVELQRKGSAPTPAPTPMPTPMPTPQPQEPQGTRNQALTAQPASPAAPTPIYKRWWFWTGAAVVVTAGVVATVLIYNSSGSGGSYSYSMRAGY